MSCTKRIAGVLGAALLAGAASAAAHETDLHHWYEHQRALTDGGTVGIVEGGMAAPAPAVGPAQAPARGTPRRAAVAPRANTDCFLEQLKLTDGNVQAICPAYEDRRWVVDEDRRDGGRHAERER